MNVTPSSKMFEGMKKIVDAFAGEEPSKLDHSQAANDVRIKRAGMFDVLHRLVGLSMREGVNRAIREAQERRNGPRDMADRNAIAQAVDDAYADRGMIHLPH